MENDNGNYLPMVPYVDPIEAYYLKKNACSDGRGQSFDGQSCGACGCNRAFHHKGEELQLLPLLDNLERGNRPIRHSRLPSKPKVVRRKKRVKVTPEDEALMECITDIIGWDPRRHDKAEADRLCKRLNISRAYYLQWIRDMKLIRDSEREAVRVEAEREAEIERAAREVNETAAAAGSLLLLCSS